MKPGAETAAWDRAQIWTGSPIFRRIFVRGFLAAVEGAPETPPYTYETSGQRWRAFANMWQLGYAEGGDFR